MDINQLEEQPPKKEVVGGVVTKDGVTNFWIKPPRGSGLVRVRVFWKSTGSVKNLQWAEDKAAS